MEHKCKQCGAAFKSRKTKRVYCSRFCYGKAYSGPNSLLYKHGRGYVNDSGYRLVSKDGVEMREHRRVMEEHLGRPLAENEVVHHRDHNRLNNQLDNLFLTTNKEHSRMHRKTLRTADAKQCSKCGEIKLLGEFYVRRTDPDGWDSYRSDCKECGRAAVREARAEHRQPPQLGHCRKCGATIAMLRSDSKYCSRKCFPSYHKQPKPKPIASETHKRCSICGITKLRSEFHPRRPDAKWKATQRSECKDCTVISNRQAILRKRHA